MMINYFQLLCYKHTIRQCYIQCRHGVSTCQQSWRHPNLTNEKWPHTARARWPQPIN